MKVLIYTSGSDTGGQGSRIETAFGRLEPGWDVTSIAANPNRRFAYPDAVNGTNRARRLIARDVYAEADVVHLRHYLRAWSEWDKGTCKPVVLHYHGSDLRAQRGTTIREANEIGATVVVSTLDLTLVAPGIRWLPSPYDVHALNATRVPNQSDTIRIAYFPTASAVKSLPAFMAAYRSLSQRYDLELLTNVRRDTIVVMANADVMRAKATADIYFDQVKLGYGNNAIEAWSMGLPVIAGTEDPRVRDLMLDTFGELPYLEATEQTIEPVLARLIESRAMREDYGQRGLAHVLRFHDDRVVVDLLKSIYSEARPTVQRSIPMRSGRAWKRAA